MLACKERLRPSNSGPVRPKNKAIGAARPDFERLASLLVGGEIDDILQFLEARLGAGVAIEALLARLLAPAARRLGALWEADECDFLHVTVGLHRLQGAIRRLVGDDDSYALGAESGRALLLPAPAETHRLGLDIVQTGFRSAGWTVNRCYPDELESVVHRNWFDLIGFSISCHRFLDGLRDAVAHARGASANPAILILVGGAIIGAEPGLVRAIGADIGAANAEEAIGLTRNLLRRRAQV
jgi:methanogenic corrinoid protein MtbC1